MVLVNQNNCAKRKRVLTSIIEKLSLSWNTNYILVIDLVCLLLLVVVPFLAYSGKSSGDFDPYQRKIVEEIESEWAYYLRINENLRPLAQAINVYVHNDIRARTFAEMIISVSRDENLDPWLVFAIISKESSFIPSAKSRSGAQGLMQIMPFWKTEIGYSFDDLYDPIVNMIYGTKILRHYMERYDTTDAALAAYNGSKGSTRYPKEIRRILKSSRDLSVGAVERRS